MSLDTVVDEDLLAAIEKSKKEISLSSEQKIKLEKKHIKEAIEASKEIQQSDEKHVQESSKENFELNSIEDPDIKEVKEFTLKIGENLNKTDESS